MPQSITNMSQVWMDTNTRNSISMSVSTLGYGTSTNSSLLVLNVDGDQKFRVDTTGRLRMPYQPVASVSYGGGDISATNIIPLNTTPIVRGGMAISSNRITVPVAGTYLVGYHHLATNTGCQIQIRVNGTSINSGSGASTQIHPNGNHGNGSVQNPVAMNASDYIEFFVINSTVHGNSGYNRMYAFLLG